VSRRAHVEAKLRERARQLARPVHQEQERGEDHLVVAVGTVQLAIPVISLRQTATPGPVTRLPGLPPDLTGVRALRGDVVCLADTAALVGTSTSSEPAAQHVVVLEDTSPLGLLVDEVLGLRHLDPVDVHAPPATAAAAATLPAMLAGVTTDGALVVDTAAVLTDARLKLPALPAHDEGRP
jgi:chemotaxis signal transduction protein